MDPSVGGIRSTAPKYAGQGAHEFQDTVVVAATLSSVMNRKSSSATISMSTKYVRVRQMLHNRDIATPLTFYSTLLGGN
jgi:hypothetical protein